jgi:hypothetical protein
MKLQEIWTLYRIENVSSKETVVSLRIFLEICVIIVIIWISDWGTGWTTGIQVPAMQDFFLRRNLQTGFGVHPAPVQWYRCFFFSSEVKRPMRVGNHSPLSNTEVKNVFSYIRATGTVSPFGFR